MFINGFVAKFVKHQQGGSLVLFQLLLKSAPFLSCRQPINHRESRLSYPSLRCSVLAEFSLSFDECLKQLQKRPFFFGSMTHHLGIVLSPIKGSFKYFRCWAMESRGSLICVWNFCFFLSRRLVKSHVRLGNLKIKQITGPGQMQHSPPFPPAYFFAPGCWQYIPLRRPGRQRHHPWPFPLLPCCISC